MEYLTLTCTCIMDLRKVPSPIQWQQIQLLLFSMYSVHLQLATVLARNIAQLVSPQRIVAILVTNTIVICSVHHRLININSVYSCQYAWQRGIHHFLLGAVLAPNTKK